MHPPTHKDNLATFLSYDHFYGISMLLLSHRYPEKKKKIMLSLTTPSFIRGSKTTSEKEVNVTSKAAPMHEQQQRAKNGLIMIKNGPRCTTVVVVVECSTQVSRGQLVKERREEMGVERGC